MFLFPKKKFTINFDETGYSSSFSPKTAVYLNGIFFSKQDLYFWDKTLIIRIDNMFILEHENATFTNGLRIKIKK